MDDKSLPPGGLPLPAAPHRAESDDAGRRAFVRRAIVAGAPIVLATVTARSAYAQTTSGCGSLEPSGSCDGEIPLIGEDISKPT